MDIDDFKPLAGAANSVFICVAAVFLPVFICIVLLTGYLGHEQRQDNDIAEYCGDTYTLDVSPLRTKVSCRGEEFVIFPNVDEMSPEEFRAYLEAKEGIPVGLKRDLRTR